jgi:hypothetical protein
LIGFHSKIAELGLTPFRQKGLPVMKSYWMEHKGKRVFIAEYSHFGTDSASLKKEAEETIELLSKEPHKSVLVISNVEGTNASLGNAQVLMDILPVSNPIVRKRCAIGSTGMGWGFIQSFNRLTGSAQIRPFHTLEEALDWIVED